MNITDKVCVVTRQRYLVMTMCLVGVVLTSVNWLGFLWMLQELVYHPRLELTRSACPPPDHRSHHRARLEEFMWGKHLVLQLMLSYPVGYLVGRLPMGLATDRHGAKTLFGYSVFVPAVLSLVTPLCARASPYVMLANRFIGGIFATAQPPAVLYLAARWFPGHRRGVMMAVVLMGVPLGSALSYMLAHLVLHVTHRWVTMFYGVGLAEVTFSYLWQAFVYDDPLDHPHITREELLLLTTTVPVYSRDTEMESRWFRSWPWRSLLTSGPLWTLALAYSGYAWFYQYVCVILPAVYFPEIHYWHFSQHEELVCAMYLMVAAVTVLAGYLSDTVVRLGLFDVTHVTKIYYAISTVIGPVLIVVATHSGCDVGTVFVYYVLGLALLGFGFVAQALALLSLADNFVGTTNAVTSLAAILAVPTELYMADLLTDKDSVSQWKTLSYFVSASCVVTTAIYLQWGNCDPQWWNLPKGEDPVKANDLESVAAMKLSRSRMGSKTNVFDNRSAASSAAGVRTQSPRADKTLADDGEKMSEVKEEK